MSAYNTVSAEIQLPGCKLKCDILVQFKYGECRQHNYRVGQKIAWGGNQVGKSGAKHVVVDGCLDGSCHYDGIPEDYEVHIEDDHITRVVPSSGQYDFVKAKEAYIVL